MIPDGTACGSNMNTQPDMHGLRGRRSVRAPGATIRCAPRNVGDRAHAAHRAGDVAAIVARAVAGSVEGEPLARLFGDAASAPTFSLMGLALPVFNLGLLLASFTQGLKQIQPKVLALDLLGPGMEFILAAALAWLGLRQIGLLWPTCLRWLPLPRSSPRAIRRATSRASASGSPASPAPASRRPPRC